MRWQEQRMFWRTLASNTTWRKNWSTAVVLNPNLGYAWLIRGWVSIMRGEVRDALESFTTVLRLDPIDPARAGAWSGLACAHNALGDFVAGYELATRALQAETAIYSLDYFVINAVPAGRIQ